MPMRDDSSRRMPETIGAGAAAIRDLLRYDLFLTPAKRNPDLKNSRDPIEDRLKKSYRRAIRLD